MWKENYQLEKKTFYLKKLIRQNKTIANLKRKFWTWIENSQNEKKLINLKKAFSTLNKLQIKILYLKKNSKLERRKIIFKREIWIQKKNKKIKKINWTENFPIKTKILKLLAKLSTLRENPQFQNKQLEKILLT